MKTKTLLAALAAACGIGAAQGEVYTWQGGASGDWNAAANWQAQTDGVSGVPGAGDAAVFAASATITTDFAIGAGTLAISNAAGTVLTFDCSISGAGGIAKGDAGALVLKKENPFQGAFVSTGTVDANWGKSKEHTSEVTIFHPGALGTLKAEFDPDYKYGHGSRLIVDGSLGQSDFVFTIPVSITGDNADAGNFKVQNCTTLTCKEPFTSPCRFRLDLSGLKTFTCEKDYTCDKGAYSVLYDGCEFFLKGKTACGTYYVGNSTRVHFYTSDNYFATWHAGGKTICHAENALPKSCKSIEFVTVSWNANCGTIDLGGFDQTLATTAAWTVPSLNTYGFHSDAPATLHLVETIAAQPAFRGFFSGAASLEWAPADATREFAFNETTQKTSGKVKVSAGTVRVKGGAGFANLGALEVASGAAFAVDADAGSVFATNVAVAANGKLKIGEERTIVCRTFAVDGEDKPEGRYAAADLPGVVEGAGAVVVYKRDVATWQGGNMGLWSDGANWSGGVAPAAGDRVIVSGGALALDVATPRLSTFELSGGATLVFTNSWDACLAADEVRILGSTVTCAGAFTNENAKCRVHFACDTFLLDAKSKIDLDGKGWSGGYWVDDGTSNPSKSVVNDRGDNLGGFGPGCASKSTAGASHLGLGARFDFSVLDSGVYDDPFAPVEPGSGGHGLQISAYSRVKFDFSHGGGACFVDATGGVTIDGVISACGLSSTTHFYYIEDTLGNYVNSAGAGGSVYVRCKKISGAGTLRADGGNGAQGVVAAPWNDATWRNTPGAGGGGGVAIVCSDDAQTAAAVSKMTVSAAAGHYQLDGGLTWATLDDFNAGAEPGTVHLSCKALVDGLIGHGLCGKLVGWTSYVYDGDLDWKWGHVRFAETGAVFAVTGNLTITGDWSRVDVGGVAMPTNWAARAYVCAGDKKITFSVGGDCVVSNGAALFVYAAEVPGEKTWGADVAVGGALHVGALGHLHPVSDFGRGGAPHFTAASFAVDALGEVNADGAGGSGGWNSGAYTTHYPAGSHNAGVGTGAGDAYCGGSHGGMGGQSWYQGKPFEASIRPKATNDVPWRPIFSGAGGGSGGYNAAGAGGGVFHLVCTGPVRVDGAISVNGCGVNYTSWVYTRYFGSGAGGSVFLAGTVFSAGEGASISARGGDVYVGMAGISSAAGGGGRIAFEAGVDHFGEDGFATTRGENPAAKRLAKCFAGFAPAIAVDGGKAVVKAEGGESIEGALGGDGTTWYSATTRLPGTALLVR